MTTAFIAVVCNILDPYHQHCQRTERHDGEGFRTEQFTATVLQPGRYTPVHNGLVAAKNIVKHLQNSIITGRASTEQSTPRATLDQLVKVRILLRQPHKAPQ